MGKFREIKVKKTLHRDKIAPIFALLINKYAIMPNTKLPRKKPPYSIKGQNKIKELREVLKASLEEVPLGEGYAHALWIRELEADALIGTGDVKPKQKCKHCRERGYIRRALPKKSGHYEEKDFKKTPCPCVIDQVELLSQVELKEIHVQAIKERDERKAKHLAGANGEAPTKPASRKTRVKKELNEPKAEAEVKPPTKRRVKKSQTPGEEA